MIKAVNNKADFLIYLRPNYGEKAIVIRLAGPFRRKPASYNGTLRLDSGFAARPPASLRGQFPEYGSPGLGNMYGPERDLFDLSFSVPSECADRVADGSADIGIIPVAEIKRLQLPYLREVGIACRGPVRTILLISKTRPEDIRTLAADSSSRTSVMLTRIVLKRKYGCVPQVRIQAPGCRTCWRTPTQR